MGEFSDQKARCLLTSFLPPVYFASVQVYQSEIDTSVSRRPEATRMLKIRMGSWIKSHLIDLLFQRPRPVALLRLYLLIIPGCGVFNTFGGLSCTTRLPKICDAGYLGQHWLST